MALSEQKHYVLQRQAWKSENTWETYPQKYETYEMAEAARQQMRTASLWRVAESYTVTRYKAVKPKGGRA